MTHIIIGGGAAGYFSAVTFAQNHPGEQVLLLEKYQQVLSKVRISGGGRCNVTHSCFDPKILVQNYPRGYKELLGPFHRFQPKNTFAWFESRGVSLKTEDDGRVFPVSDNSQTIIDCLVNATKDLGVKTCLNSSVRSINKTADGFEVHLLTGEVICCETILLATGSSSQGHALAASLGHTIVPCVPSLFTFNVPSSPFQDLSGVTVPKVRLSIKQHVQEGPLLITHWGFSGPSVLKLSAWAARLLHGLSYHTELFINWVPDCGAEQIRHKLQEHRIHHAKRHIAVDVPFELPRNLWKALLAALPIDSSLPWSSLSNKEIEMLTQKLNQDVYQIEGKTTYKSEFVTCGGVCLQEVNFKTMESKICPGLYFAGEILDIDGVTGGFNFQAAWTTGWIAGQAK